MSVAESLINQAGFNALKALRASDLSDFVYEKREFIPRRTFGLIENAASYELI
ncbi:MAG: hypothetical protein QNJ63_16105 [Calothrix sp. MO_192.B10]|nr:hypothetical protein [Calothrix sp. MO_192.B10]